MNGDDRIPLEVHENEELILTVRDRRRPKHYRIDNLIMEHYYPLIRETGYALYSLLVYQSNPARDESCSVSYTFLSEYLDEGRSTLSYYLTFLEYCGLIYRDRPEVILQDSNGHKISKRQGNKSNTYYILDITPVDHKSLENLRTTVEKSDVFSDDYQALFTKRILSWIPIQKHWAMRRARRIKTVVGQQALPFENNNGSPPAADEDAPANEQAPTLTTLDILTRINIVDGKIQQELSNYPAHQVLGMHWFASTEKGLDPNRVGGFIIMNLRKKTVPPAGFTKLAITWLEMSDEERDELLNLAYAPNSPQPYAEMDLRSEYDFADEVIEVIFKLGKKEMERWLS